MFTVTAKLCDGGVVAGACDRDPWHPPLFFWAVREGNLRENGQMSFERIFDESALFRLCFVCTGNICRSPMAEVVFTDLIRSRGSRGASA